MAPERANPRRKRSLLTNDDGVDALGMKALQRIAITPLHLDLTENKALKQLKAAFQA